MICRGTLGKYCANYEKYSFLQLKATLLGKHFYLFYSVFFLPSLYLPIPKYCQVLAVLTHPHTLPSCRHIPRRTRLLLSLSSLLPPCSSLVWLPRQFSCVDLAHTLQIIRRHTVLVLDANFSSQILQLRSRRRYFIWHQCIWLRHRLCVRWHLFNQSLQNFPFYETFLKCLFLLPTQKLNHAFEML